MGGGGAGLGLGAHIGRVTNLTAAGSLVIGSRSDLADRLDPVDHDLHGGGLAAFLLGRDLDQHGLHTHGLIDQAAVAVAVRILIVGGHAVVDTGHATGHLQIAEEEAQHGGLFDLDIRAAGVLGLEDQIGDGIALAHDVDGILGLALGGDGSRNHRSSSAVDVHSNTPFLIEKYTG